MEIILVILIIAAAVYLFVSERFRSDLVALMVLGTLALVALFQHLVPWIHPEKWITPEECIAGFSNPATITVAAMFVLSAGLQKTGAVAVAGRLLKRLANYHIPMLLVTMLAVGAVSAFINNTAAVAVFLPLVLTACAGGKVSASKLLIPLSFASQFGGVCTLIGSSTNLLVSTMSNEAGLGPFRMFEFAPLGLIMLGTGTLYLLLVSHWLLPDRRGSELTENYQLRDYITELRVLEGSPLAGQTLAASQFGRKHGVTVVEILRAGLPRLAPLYEPIQPKDVLLVRGGARDLMDAKAAWKLEIEPEFQLKDATLQSKHLQLAEVLIAPRSGLIDRTLGDVQFRRRYEAIVLAIRARRKTVREKLNQVRLKFGDALLLLGPTEELARLRGDPNFLVLQQVDEPALRRAKIPLAVGVIAAVVALAAFNVMPILVSAILGCIALVVTRCLTLEEAYGSIDWRVIFLLAGVIPLGSAMENSGAAHLLGQWTMTVAGPLGPMAVLAVIYGLTALLTALMSNNATAVLMVPIAISSAAALGVEARPFLIAVCFAASTCFATPVGYQTNTMVLHPGGYRFADYVRIGLPLNFIFGVLAVLVIPKLWPFGS